MKRVKIILEPSREGDAETEMGRAEVWSDDLDEFIAEAVKC